MLMELLGDAGQPGQRPWTGGRELGETPVEDGGHVCRGLKVASGGGCVQVDERMLTGLSRQREQVCSEGRPRRLTCESGDDLVGSAVEHLNDLGANQLLGRNMEPVGVALDGLKESAGRFAQLSQQGAGGDGRVVAREDPLQGFGWGAWCNRVGTNQIVRVTIANYH
jgi:hypothetical protein